MSTAKRDIAKQSTSVVLAAATSGTVAAFNPGRAWISVVNCGAARAFLAFPIAAGPDPKVGPTVPTATINSGISLEANGGSWEREDYIGPVAGISTAGTTLAVAEF